MSNEEDTGWSSTLPEDLYNDIFKADVITLDCSAGKPAAFPSSLWACRAQSFIPRCSSSKASYQDLVSCAPSPSCLHWHIFHNKSAVLLHYLYPAKDFCIGTCWSWSLKYQASRTWQQWVFQKQLDLPWHTSSSKDSSLQLISWNLRASRRKVLWVTSVLREGIFQAKSLLTDILTPEFFQLSIHPDCFLSSEEKCLWKVTHFYPLLSDSFNAFIFFLQKREKKVYLHCCLRSWHRSFCSACRTDGDL